MKNIISIKHRNNELDHDEFGKLMAVTETLMNKEAVATPCNFQKLSATELEQISVEFIKQACGGSPFDPDSVKLVSGHRFPDILLDKSYGVEVKSTVGNKWMSTGSSIVESTRVEGIERIFMLFGKLGGQIPEFKCRPYQDVLYDIAITHSPRYLINMELKEKETIFAKMGISYDELRTSNNAIKQVIKYYQQKAINEHKSEMPWWLSSVTEEETTPFNIKLWNGLNHAEKIDITAKALILFQELMIPQSSRTKYNRLVLWLCSTFQIVSHNIRDSFTAGGQVSEIQGYKLSNPVPKIFSKIIEMLPIIKALLNAPDDMLLSQINIYNPAILKDANYFGNWLEFVKKDATKNGFSEFINVLEHLELC